MTHHRPTRQQLRTPVLGGGSRSAGLAFFALLALLFFDAACGRADIGERLACITNSTCPSKVCGIDGFCEGNPVPCEADLVCGAGRCVDGYCWPPADCTTTADCAAGFTCVAGSCKPSGGCSQNIDCPVTQVCFQGGCTDVGQCVVDLNCPCEQGTCTNHTCGGGSTCVGGGPVEPVPCQLNSDCQIKELCFEGLCRIGVECLTHANCPAGQACFGKLCWSL